MITTSELNTVELSPTKKDFYQIWNELLDIASKLSERWDPTSTNESDPGIVLLKVLTAVADKLNYTIDANTLEAFMPSAAQEESMRKLTEMMGYSMSYYQSATTDVKIAYTNNNNEALTTSVFINKYTNIKDIDNNINYVTLKDIYLNDTNLYDITPCIEGELVECETDDNNIVSLFHFDDNKRYYLPETQIAENGIFITNITNGIEGELWDRVDNLNTKPRGSRVFKFGFDSREGLPYIQFPDDISILIEDGLKIKYLRTNGINGNVSAKTLCKMETPAAWAQYENTDASYLSVDYYTISNPAAATNGRNKESINDAYTNYKKTIGTFDTLVTCRDYMNRIYQMTVADTSSTPLVSNVIVSDIRDDINKAMTICTFTDHGVEYKTMAKPVITSTVIEITKEELPEATEANFGNMYKVSDNTDTYYTRCIYDGTNYAYIVFDPKELTHFDLVLYPFRAVSGLNNKAEYIKSFKYDTSNLVEIKTNLAENKAISHNFVEPASDDIACIKNYYQLTAKITTVKKVNALEQADILGKVYAKLYEAFNMRKVEFGETLPYESILKVLEEADPRIKFVNLEDPDIITKYCLVNGTEYFPDIIEESNSDQNKIAKKIGNTYYNKLALNNILAGRVELFDYDLDFKPEFTEVTYSVNVKNEEEEEETISYNLTYPEVCGNDNNTNIINNVIVQKDGIHKISSNLEIDLSEASDIVLKENEVIQFKRPNLKTIKTYPAYVNYYLKLNDTSTTFTPNIPATMQTLYEFILHSNTPGKTTLPADIKNNDETITSAEEIAFTNLITYFGNNSSYTSLVKAIKFNNIEEYNIYKSKYYYIFTRTRNATTYTYKAVTDTPTDSNTTYYYAGFDTTNPVDLVMWNKYVTKEAVLFYDAQDEEDKANTIVDQNYKIKGLYKNTITSLEKSLGELVDENHRVFKLVDQWNPINVNPFTYYYVPRLWSSKVSTSDDLSPSKSHTPNGLGQHAEYHGIKKDQEYELKDGEYLLINYTSSTSTEGNDVKTVINEKYDKGTIIKANFELMDSETHNKVYAFTKKSGFSFTDKISTTISGMFTLGTSEQIEIRDFMKVTLDEFGTNMYWILNAENESSDSYNRIKFPFDDELTYYKDNTYKEVSSTKTNYSRHLSYTLKDGEYIFYTGANKTDIAWFGSGTKIRRTAHTPELYKLTSDNNLSIETILTQGLNASIPWKTFDFSTVGETKKALDLIEYQYINLLAGDKLVNVYTDLGKDSTYTGEITATPVLIKGADYILGASSNKDIISELTPMNFDPQGPNNWASWEVSSRLEFNVGPTISQTLTKRDGITPSIKLEGLKQKGEENNTTEIEITPVKGAPVSFKTNKQYQTSYSELSTTTKEKDSEGKIIKEISDFKIKVFASKNLTKQSGLNTEETINLNNFGNNFTKITFEDKSISAEQRKTNAMTSINVAIPADKTGLIMFYTISNNPENIRLKAISTKTNSDLALSIYNKAEWWEGQSIKDEEDPTKIALYQLRKGINIVQVKESCTIEIFSDPKGEATLILGNLDIINRINPKIAYKAIELKEGESGEKISDEEQLLKDIKMLDPDYLFYYNCPVPNALSIDMNKEDEEDTLEHPLSLYDINNVNNKFVISELDADYFSTGITIAKTSRSN